MSSTLAEILFTNLFQNAIRYNTEAGFIAIKIEKRTITIANAGEILAEPPETLFTRFKRKSHIEESLGLGLSIVKRICDLYEIDIKYIHDAGLHQLILKFPKNSLT
jgi:signal transduction histidine kinase